MVEWKNHKPPIDDITAKSYSFFDWQCYFRTIFNDNNRRIKKVGYQDNQVAFMRGYIISHISQDLGDLAEAIRESDNAKLGSKIGSMFAWIFALANEFEENIEDIIYEKYPGFCPYCGHKKNCDCAWWIPAQTKKNKEGKFEKPIEEGEVGHTKPDQLPGWITIWEIIYGKKYQIAQSIADIMYKLLEEEAEILEELDKTEGKTLDREKEYYGKAKREFADFISWFLALLYKLEERRIDRNTLPNILHNKFGTNGCYWCKKPNCECQPKWLNETS